MPGPALLLSSSVPPQPGGILSVLFFRGPENPVQTQNATSLILRELTITTKKDDFQIINLTNRILTQDEINRLRKGLGFVPTTRFEIHFYGLKILIYLYVS